jgi:uncharacterized protein involved in type VI secretion and phage assembly
VIGDAPAVHKPIDGDAELAYNDVASAATEDVVHEFRLTTRLGPGKFIARDFHFATVPGHLMHVISSRGPSGVWAGA